jgi:hypothetical protein
MKIIEKLVGKSLKLSDEKKLHLESNQLKFVMKKNIINLTLILKFQDHHMSVIFHNYSMQCLNLKISKRKYRIQFFLLEELKRSLLDRWEHKKLIKPIK